MTDVSEAAAAEIREAAASSVLRSDLEKIARSRHNPFMKAGVVDVDVYIDFVSQFNEFINHEPKRFVRMIDKDIRL